MRFAFLMVVLAAAGCAAAPADPSGRIRAEAAGRLGVSGEIGAADFTKELTADEAVRVALMNNPGLRGTYATLGVGRAEVLAAELLKNPVFSASVRFPARPHYGVDVGIETEFVDLLFLPARKRIAEAAFAGMQAHVLTEAVRLGAEVREAYYRLEFAQGAAALAGESVTAAEAAEEMAGRLQAAGDMTELARDLRTARLLEAQAAASAAKLEAAGAREKLALLMGVAERAGEIRVGTLGDAGKGVPGLAEVEAAALAQNAELLEARARVGAVTARMKVARVMGIFGGGAIGAEAVRDPDVKTTVGPTVAIPLPIFDQGQGAVMQADAEYAEATAEVEAVRQRVVSEVRTAYGELAAARERAELVNGKLVPLRGKILQESVRQYNAMELSAFDLLEVKEGEIAARRTGLEARLAVALARVRVAAVSGGDFWQGRGDGTTEAQRH